MVKVIFLNIKFLTGKKNYPNKDKYEGEWVNDHKHGFGMLTFSNGDKYEGEFQNDAFTGKGLLLLLFF